MIINPIYKGKRKWNKEYFDIPESIIDPEFWDKVNLNLKKNKKNAGKKTRYHYLLNGLVYCGNCGNEYRGKKRLKGRDNAYKCKGKHSHYRTCEDSRGLSIPRLETFIIKHLFISRDFSVLFKFFT
jgi:site-specific DNA recombinase